MKRSRDPPMASPVEAPGWADLPDEMIRVEICRWLDPCSESMLAAVDRRTRAQCRAIAWMSADGRDLSHNDDCLRAIALAPPAMRIQWYAAVGREDRTEVVYWAREVAIMMGRHARMTWAQVNHVLVTEIAETSALYQQRDPGCLPIGPPARPDLAARDMPLRFAGMLADEARADEWVELMATLATDGVFLNDDDWWSIVRRQLSLCDYRTVPTPARLAFLGTTVRLAAAPHLAIYSAHVADRTYLWWLVRMSIKHTPGPAFLLQPLLDAAPHLRDIWHAARASAGRVHDTLVRDCVAGLNKLCSRFYRPTDSERNRHVMWFTWLAREMPAWQPTSRLCVVWLCDVSWDAAAAEALLNRPFFTAALRGILGVLWMRLLLHHPDKDGVLVDEDEVTWTMRWFSSPAAALLVARGWLRVDATMCVKLMAWLANACTTVQRADDFLGHLAACPPFPGSAELVALVRAWGQVLRLPGA